MTKNVDLKKNLFIILIIIILLFYVIFSSYIKYNPDRWLHLYGNTDAIDKISNFSFWWYSLTGQMFGSFVYIFPILLSTIAVSSFFKVYHTGYFQNIIQRIGYKKTIKYEIIKCWIYSLILPIISLITLGVSKVLYKNSIISKYNEVEGYPFQLVNSQMENMNPYLFIFYHMIITVLFSLIIINIAIIFTRYLKKSYLVTIASYVTIIALENFNNLILAPIVARLSGIDKMFNGFSLYNLYYLDAIPSLQWEFLFAIILLIVSLIIIYIVYRKRESVCINYE